MDIKTLSDENFHIETKNGWSKWQYVKLCVILGLFVLLQAVFFRTSKVNKIFVQVYQYMPLIRLNIIVIKCWFPLIVPGKRSEILEQLKIELWNNSFMKLWNMFLAIFSTTRFFEFLFLTYKICAFFIK